MSMNGNNVSMKNCRMGMTYITEAFALGGITYVANARPSISIIYKINRGMIRITMVIDRAI